MTSMKYNLRPVWDGILDLYERFDAYCKKHQLRYYVTGGTLLGAVRHNGFIPWDDDFDVVMPRPDYHRFLDLVKREKIIHAQVHAKELDSSWRLMFAKVCETCPDVIERVKHESKLSLTDGICIDVIPIDGMPKALIPFYYWAVKRSTWRHAYAPGLFWRIMRLLFCGGDEFARDPLLFEKWLASYPYDSSPSVDDYNGSYKRFKGRSLTANSFGTPIWHKFDRLEVPIPKEWDKFLRIIYGEYRQLPPAENRHPGHQN